VGLFPDRVGRQTSFPIGNQSVIKLTTSDNSIKSPLDSSSITPSVYTSNGRKTIVKTMSSKSNKKTAEEERMYERERKRSWRAKKKSEEKSIVSTSSKLSSGLSSAGWMHLSDGEGGVNIQTLRECWLRLHSMHPYRNLGLQIIDHLAGGGGTEVRLERLALKEVPNQSHVLYDVEQYGGTFRNVLNGETDYRTGFGDFVRGWTMMGEGSGVDPRREGNTPYCALAVPSIDTGLGLISCIKDLPMELRRSNVYVERGEGREYEFISTITPAGTITGPHHDGRGSGQILVMMTGYKIMIWWDGTEKVEELFKPMHGSRRGDVAIALWNAVLSWPDLNWAIMRPGYYIDMAPGTIHAVMSPTNSSISGWIVIKPEWVDDGSLEKAMLYEIECLKDKLKAPSGNDDWIGSHMEEMNTEIKRWELWKPLACHSGIFKKKLSVMIEKVTKELEILKKHRNYELAMSMSPIVENVRLEKRNSIDEEE
jgi:hypothetical protein